MGAGNPHRRHPRERSIVKHCWWIAAFCAAFALGCGGKEAERTGSNGDDARTATNDPKAAAGDDSADSAGKNAGRQAAKTDPRTPATRPDGMPSDVPMYPYVRIKLPPGEAAAKMMVLETDDAFEDVRSYYVDKFEKNGWTTLHNAPQAIVAEKGGRRTSVSLGKAGSITRIVMNFTGQ